MDAHGARSGYSSSNQHQQHQNCTRQSSRTRDEQHGGPRESSSGRTHESTLHVPVSGQQSSPDNYPTIADRLLALRASQESNSSVELTPRYGHSMSQSTENLCNVRRNSSVNSRTVQINRDHGRDKDSVGSNEKRNVAKRVIKVFTAVLLVLGIPMLVIGIVLISLQNKTDTLYNTGLVLLILGATMAFAALIFIILLCLGLCNKPTHTTIQVQSSNGMRSSGLTGSNSSKKESESIYHPQPAPGYHTPLPFGPTVPGYIPPQVVFSKYAKKAFNHRAILSGTDTPVSEESYDDLPQGFPAYPMKSPRAGPSSDDAGMNSTSQHHQPAGSSTSSQRYDNHRPV